MLTLRATEGAGQGQGSGRRDGGEAWADLIAGRSAIDRDGHLVWVAASRRAKVCREKEAVLSPRTGAYDVPVAIVAARARRRRMWQWCTAQVRTCPLTARPATARCLGRPRSRPVSRHADTSVRAVVVRQPSTSNHCLPSDEPWQAPLSHPTRPAGRYGRQPAMRC